VPRPVRSRAAGCRGARELAATIERALRRCGNRERAEQEQRYLRSMLAHFGVSVPVMRKLTRDALRQAPKLDRTQLLAAVEYLWQRGIHELRMAAVELLIAELKLLTAADFASIERLIRDARTWALVDNLAAIVAGALVERYPRLLRQLDRWARDEDFWIRRAALLALLGPLRSGGGDFERFTRYADAMLEEKQFFIRKAIGWVLRETSKGRPALVHDWLRPRTARVSGVTLREAVRYLTPAQRARLAR
jgi:3-methyladenine DNA glycosylase AlkD